MHTDTINLIYFSPTNTSKTIADAIAKGLQPKKISHINLTPLDSATKEFTVPADGFAIIGMPVYAGRLPEDAAARMRRVRGNNTPAVLVVLYGNRAYEDALIELRDLALAQGFIPIAAGAFIGEHSFSDDTAQIAHRRPDRDDLARATEFGTAIRSTFAEMQNVENTPLLEVPGNVPYAEYRVLKNVAPTTDQVSCTLCSLCAFVCPTGAITIQDNTVVTDASLCILCCACVKRCTVGGRELVDERIVKTRNMLLTKFSERKEPETYFAT